MTRAPHRAFLRAMGLDDADIERPFVAVMAPTDELTPCNLHLAALMKHVKVGVGEGGGLGRESGLAMVADSLSMNHQGMKFSLIGRELIADAIEAVVRGHGFDALVGLAGCDKSLPGTLMGMARCNVPAVFLSEPPADRRMPCCSIAHYSMSELSSDVRLSAELKCPPQLNP